ncbi:MAG: GTP-dependent dephospho-CoA kinase family protein [Candidatus Syntropharchaeales archaeon]
MGKIIYTLPEELRSELKKPMGTLYRGNGIECIEMLAADFDLVSSRLIAVGDVVTHYILSFGVVPTLVIVDDRTKRGEISSEIRTGKGDFKEVEVENPAGVITEELDLAIKEAIEQDVPIRLWVDGEEDLAVFPVIKYAPLSSIVLYGQPDEGVVAVLVDESIKRKVGEMYGV